MSITGPTTGKPGGRVCITVSGGSSASVRASIGGVDLPATVSSPQEGTHVICVLVPANARGTLEFQVECGGEIQTAFVVIR